MAIDMTHERQMELAREEIEQLRKQAEDEKKRADALMKELEDLKRKNGVPQ